MSERKQTTACTASSEHPRHLVDGRTRGDDVVEDYEASTVNLWSGLEDAGDVGEPLMASKSALRWPRPTRQQAPFHPSARGACEDRRWIKAAFSRAIWFSGHRKQNLVLAYPRTQTASERPTHILSTAILEEMERKLDRAPKSEEGPGIVEASEAEIGGGERGPGTDRAERFAPLGAASHAERRYQEPAQGSEDHLW